MKPETARRIPRQARSKERVERILDAAAAAFAESGFEAATTEQIAARAGTSIGSVYQFFPNKEALFDAIAARYLERSRDVFERLMQLAAGGAPWAELLDASVDAFAAFDRTDPDFRAVWSNWQRAAGFMAAGQALNREFAARAEQVLGSRAKKLGKKKRALVARMIVETMSAMLFFAAREPELGKQVVAETKVLLRRYLAPYAE